MLGGGPWLTLVGIIKIIFLAWLVMVLLGVLRIRRWLRRGGGWGPPRGDAGPWGGPWSYGPYRHWHGPYGPGRRMGRGPWGDR